MRVYRCDHCKKLTTQLVDAELYRVKSVEKKRFLQITDNGKMILVEKYVEEDDDPAEFCASCISAFFKEISRVENRNAV